VKPEEHLPRLKRLDRLFTSHPLYFVTACTEDRKPILASPKVHEDFRKFCQAGLARGVFVGKYVLMPDHLHLFVAFGDEYEAALTERRINRQSQTRGTEHDAVRAVFDHRPSAPSGPNRQSQTDATEHDAVTAVFDHRPTPPSEPNRQSQTDATEHNAVAAVYDRRLSPLSAWMKSLKNSLSKTWRGMNVPAPHWQKGFFDHVMRSEESYSEKWLYVAENPVRKKLAVRFEDWPYQGEMYPLAARGHV